MLASVQIFFLEMLLENYLPHNVESLDFDSFLSSAYIEPKCKLNKDMRSIDVLKLLELNCRAHTS